MDAEALELADDHIDDIEHFDLEVLQRAVQIRQDMTQRNLRKKRQPAADDVEIQVVTPMHNGIGSRDFQQAVLRVFRQRVGL